MNSLLSAWRNGEAGNVLKCHHCEKDVDLPFRCPFCGGYFCGDHRLPENHACPELLRVRTRKSPPMETHYPPKTEGEPPAMEYPLRIKKAGWSSRTEMLHLTIATLIVVAVGLSMESPGFRWIFLVLEKPTRLLPSALAFAFIFVFHELAHKIVAKHYNLWAEFRLTLLGAILTLISIAPTPIKVISPGAVMVAGAADKRTIGITALAGPFASIALTSVFFVLYFFLPQGSFASMVLGAASLSASIAFLNLIPLGILDGAKVFWWNKPVWAASFFGSIILMAVVLGHLLLG